MLHYFEQLQVALDCLDRVGRVLGPLQALVLRPELPVL